MRRYFFCIVIFFVFLIGCVSMLESEKELLKDMQNIGEFTANESGDPIVKQAGVDMAMNSGYFLNKYGEPLSPPQEYAPELSDRLRKNAIAESQTSMPFDKILGKASGIVTPFNAAAGVVLGLLGSVFAVFRKFKSTKEKLHTVYRGVEKAIGNPKKYIKDTLRDVAKESGNYLEINKELDQLREKGVI